MEKERVKVRSRRKMVCLKVTLRRMRSTVLVDLNGKMEKFTKGSLKNPCLTDRERLFTLMERLFRANGKKTITGLFWHL